MPSLSPVPSLPRYSGPYLVGTTEFEVPCTDLGVNALASDSHIKTIKFRLYYPTNSKTKSIYWLPSPQKQWTEAYASFLGLSSKWSGFISKVPSLLSYATMPVNADAPILGLDGSSRYPLAIFSHGLGGNCNTYSQICGSLASYGVICAAPEHRDGSAPVSFIRSADGAHEASIAYKRVSHNPTEEVLNARNAQLRIRLWELSSMYKALERLDAGGTMKNYAASKTIPTPSFANVMDLRPGRVSWLGHSFGAASIVQFVKSIYYHRSTPSLQNSTHERDPNWEPLLPLIDDSGLLQQITSDSPIALLDLWTMPLRADSTKWLWERPLPCYDRSRSEADTHPATNTIAIMSEGFYKWTDLLNRTRALLSFSPSEAITKLERRGSIGSDLQTDSEPPNPTIADVGELETEGSKDQESPSVTASPMPSADASRSGTPVPTGPNNNAAVLKSLAPKLFMIPQSAHLSQSDFGVLFPNLTRYFMKAQDPEETMELNIRAILAVLRGQGLPIAKRLSTGKNTNENGNAADLEQDQILNGTADLKRWVAVPLISRRS